jgi:hypothetical protein
MARAIKSIKTPPLFPRHHQHNKNIFNITKQENQMMAAIIDAVSEATSKGTLASKLFLLQAPFPILTIPYV